MRGHLRIRRSSRPGTANTMKKLLAGIASIILLGTATAYAGGMAEPVMDATVVEAATSSASQQIIIPLLLLLVLVAAASAPDGSPI